jgi:hypothetical protein
MIMLSNTPVTDYTPTQVLWAMTLKNGARSYSGDNTAYDEIRNYAFNSAGWMRTPNSAYAYTNLTQEQINKAPKHLLMDSILNACENFDNDPSDDKTFMEYVAASMNGMSELYTIKGVRI